MNQVTKFGFAVAGVMVLLAVLSPLLASWNKVQSQDLGARLEPPDHALMDALGHGLEPLRGHLLDGD